MKFGISVLVSLLCMGFSMAQKWTTPVIEGYGKIKSFKDVAVQPDASLEYKLVFDITSESEMDGVNKGLWKIARLINMLGSSGIPSDNVHIVAAIHGGATFATLNDTKHKKKYDKANPNTELLGLLKDYGVELYVCSQATAARNITAEDLNPNTELALSAMTVLSNYQLKGYALMP
ncbi:DsrE family protein [Maribacter sp. PR1]|uniref:DsrE family protein n=1 Tax=Maribacter cobaltidurans TaxID=1178778 RepID=A0ABU7IVQ9_9FLAO|nr:MULTISPECIES: DsrE family protein [Maribacter]MDC6389310.1 DsrE family protein [Maribacter sp. PR1]MEE1976698.1 DsrE family protein [Maribacter cobaltidurans]